MLFPLSASTSVNWAARIESILWLPLKEIYLFDYPLVAYIERIR
jgi:hypothetical protein